MDEEVRGPRLWNLLTVLTLGMTVVVSLCYLTAFVSPPGPLGLIGLQAPPTMVALQVPPTFTPTPTRPPGPPPTFTPTNTPTITPTPTPTRTPPPTLTPSQTPTFAPTFTPTPTPGSPPPTRSLYPYTLQGEVIYTANFANTAGCAWLGIAGRVFGLEGEDVTGIAVVLKGGPYGDSNPLVTYSGSAPAYGESGWEFFLDSKPKEGEWTIQLWDQGQPVSDPVKVTTVKDCRRNLALVYFVRNH